MPAFPTWYPRAREILKTLNHAGSPSLFDRRAIERLFRVQKRQAIRLLKDELGGYRLGQNFVVDRAKIIEYVEKAIKGGGVAEAIESERTAREKLEEAEKKRAAAKGTEFEPNQSAAGEADRLPAAAEVLGPGQLLIHHQGAKDLVSRMYEILTYAGQHFPNFQKLVG